MPSSLATMTAGSGASRNEEYDAENAWTTSARRSSRKSSGQYQSWVTSVRTYLTRSSRSKGAGGTGLIGTSQASTASAAAPSIEHALRLHRLPAKNPKRGHDDGDFEAWAGLALNLAYG